MLKTCWSMLLALALALPAPARAASEMQALEGLRAQYQSLADNGGWPQWRMARTLRPGDSDRRVPDLRALLTITGDYPPAAAAPAASTLYDDTLVQAVQRFQTRHGLSADGHIGKSTQAALAVPVETRLRQIDATLRRMQERPVTAERKFILINLPAYTLYAVADGHADAVMRVIIGDRDNPTPLFDNAVNEVVFNPPWNVPERIAKNELLPKLRENPDYFVQAGFVVSRGGVAVDPHLAAAAGDEVSFRQEPGDANALGKIKFNIPNADNIYLHSTPTPRLFARDDRALSHGCIRVEAPRELAYFVLAGKPGWSREKIDATYDGDAEHGIRVDPVPVHIVYWTAFVDSRNVAHFYDDVYGMDAAPAPKDKNMTVAAK